MKFGLARKVGTSFTSARELQTREATSAATREARKARGGEAAAREARTMEVGTREDSRVRGRSSASSTALHHSGLEFAIRSGTGGSRKYRTETQEMAGKVIFSIIHFSVLTFVRSNSANSRDTRLRRDYIQDSGTRRLKNRSKFSYLFF